jgi:hypothetical protein
MADRNAQRLGSLRGGYSLDGRLPEAGGTPRESCGGLGFRFSAAAESSESLRQLGPALTR